MNKKARIKQIKRNLSVLTEKQYRRIWERVVNEKTYRQIGLETGCTKQVACKTVQTAVKKLRKG